MHWLVNIHMRKKRLLNFTQEIGKEGQYQLLHPWRTLEEIRKALGIMANLKYSPPLFLCSFV